MVEKALYEADMSHSETDRISMEILPKIQELESKQGGDWISVEERLPLAGEVVNMLSPESGGCVYSGYYSPIS